MIKCEEIGLIQEISFYHLKKPYIPSFLVCCTVGIGLRCTARLVKGCAGAGGAMGTATGATLDATAGIASEAAAGATGTKLYCAFWALAVGDGATACLMATLLLSINNKTCQTRSKYPEIMKCAKII